MIYKKEKRNEDLFDFEGVRRMRRRIRERHSEAHYENKKKKESS